jgi:hypothetical protein
MTTQSGYAATSNSSCGLAEDRDRTGIAGTAEVSLAISLVVLAPSA